MSVPVKARFGRSTYNLQTLDVSRTGAFVVAPQPPTKGQLVHISVLLPTSAKPVPLQGMVMRSVSGEEARSRSVPAGFGIHFYGLGRTNEEAWNAFFDREFDRYTGRGATQPVPAASPVAALEPGSEGHRQAIEPSHAAEQIGDAVPDDLDEPTDEWLPPEGLALARTTDWYTAPVLYRISPPDIEGIRSFRSDALESGGVTLLGASGALPGTPAVVSVVHPTTRAEFHVPGEVQPSTKGLNAVVVRFLGVTARTKHEYESFAHSGDLPQPFMGDLGPPDVEMVIFESAEETQWDVIVDRKRTVEIEKLLPLQAALDPFGKFK